MRGLAERIGFIRRRSVRVEAVGTNYWAIMAWQAMNERVDYYISAVRMKGDHITHVRVHKALSDKSFAPHGIVQPRSTVIVNLRNSRVYKTLVLEGHQAHPGEPVQLVEHGSKFYLRTCTSTNPQDDLGNVPRF